MKPCLRLRVLREQIPGPGERVGSGLMPGEKEGHGFVTYLFVGHGLAIAQFVPPHMRQRIENNPKLRIAPIDSVEIMFLAMQPKPPFDKKEVRQAVCQAINRDQIISTLLEGFASRLDGPLGPGQYGYDPNLKPKLNYDPEKAKKLLSQRIAAAKKARTRRVSGR